MTQIHDRVLNAEFDWDGFDSDAYYYRNYWLLRDDDREIMNIVRDFFADANLAPSSAAAVDVGTGTNLYPALAMLPFCATLDLIEIGDSNVDWLRREVPAYNARWDDFWKVYAERDAYAAVADPRVELARKATVQRQSLFRLPERRWDLGTMFFAACSMTANEDEFETALRRFIRALRPGAPFASAFMWHSTGYRVAGREFPAVDIDGAMVEDCLASVAYDVSISEIALGDDPLRAGYEGMIVATGRVADRP